MNPKAKSDWIFVEFKGVKFAASHSVPDGRPVVIKDEKSGLPMQMGLKKTVTYPLYLITRGLYRFLRNCRNLG